MHMKDHKKYIHKPMEALERAEYYFADAKSVLDLFMTPEMKKAIGYCGGTECGLCPMCRMNDGLNTLKFSRLNN